MQTLPSNIRSLPTYTVSSELFICTSILLIIITLFSLVMVVTWIVRSCKHIHNYQYIADHEFMVYYKNKEQKIKNDDPDDINFSSQRSNSNSSKFSITTESKHREFNRNQSRFLEFVCLSVVVVININAFSTFVVALACYMFFNIFRRFEHRQSLRLIFFVPLIVAYIPFYSESKSLT